MASRYTLEHWTAADVAAWRRPTVLWWRDRGRANVAMIARTAAFVVLIASAFAFWMLTQAA